MGSRMKHLYSLINLLQTEVATIVIIRAQVTLVVKSLSSGVWRHLGSNPSPAAGQLCDEHAIFLIWASVSSFVNGVHNDGSTS